MKKVKLFLLLFLFPCIAFPQTVTISPIPHSIAWGTKAFDNSATYYLTGAQTADFDAVALLNSKLTIGASGIEIIIGEKGDNTILPFQTEIPEKKEGYFLKIEPGRIIIAGNDSVGTYYGVQTLLQILASPEVMSVTIKDYPDMPNRGTIEGFYGNPWSHQDRIRMFEFSGKNKMDIYVYSPKDDPYHNSRWADFYPSDLALKMKELIQKAHANKVKFVWAIHLGGKGVTDATQYARVIAKLENMYLLGVRDFAVFYDDYGTETAAQQCNATNYIVNNFVRKKTDVGPILFCPTGYNRAWASVDYLTTIGNNMDPTVMIYWTGNTVVDMINYSDMTYINGYLKRNAFIWLNYPVTDYVVDHLLMGPTYGNDKTIATMVSGFTSNPMEYAEASKVSIYSIADYSWNLSAYDSQSSWLRAMRYLMPDNYNAFKIFCENNIDLGPTYHGLRRDGESAPFKTVADPFMTAYDKGTFDPAKTDALSLQFQSFRDASAELSASTSNPQMTAEIQPWLQVFDIMGNKGLSLLKMHKAVNTDDTIGFIKEYKKIDSLELVQSKIQSRNFTGSIKAPYPKPANEVVAPFLKLLKSKLILDYKRKYTYMTDVFPKVLLEEGNYLIKFNGKYLTNKNVNTTGGNPVFLADRDAVNPQRQEWTIKNDAATDRYKIINTQDLRYINELGNFGTNAYDAAWNTYSLYRMNKKYAIQNAGSAGDKFWISDGTRINVSADNQLSDGNFIFEIIPVGQDTVDYPVITQNESYYIKFGDNYLTNTNVKGTGGAPAFRPLITSISAAQQWVFSVDATSDRYKLTNKADGRYMNEMGDFGTNAYYPTWNSYILTEMNKKFSVQNAGEAGTNFWVANNNRIEKGNIGRADSYLFDIIPLSKMFNTGVKKNKKLKCEIHVLNDKIIVDEVDNIRELSLNSINGRLIRQVKNTNEIHTGSFSPGVYILLIDAGDNGTGNFKLIKRVER